MTALLCLFRTAVADVFEDQANHQVRQRLLRLRRQGSPVRQPRRAAVAGLGKQVELLWSGPKDMMRVALASHGPLPDSRRERSSLPSQPWESTVLTSTHPPAAPSKPGSRRYPPAEQAQRALAHTRPDRTSREGVPI